MKFMGWYLKTATGSAMIGGCMEFFMIKTGFCVRLLLSVIHDKVTVLESEKKAWENSPEAHAMREAFTSARKSS